MYMIKIILVNVLSVLLFSVLITNAQIKHKILPLNERVQNLMDMSIKKNFVKLNSQSFREYVKVSPRNYSLIIMLTALQPTRQCTFCRLAYDEFVIAANSYRYSTTYSNKLFFAIVDFDDGSDVFQILNINTAPVILYYPPKGQPKDAIQMDINRVGYSAEAIAKFAYERTDVLIRVFRPPNYSGTVAVITLGALLGGFLYLKRNNLEFLYNKQLWASLAVLFCFAMVSGQMWNHIRSPPLVHKSSSSGGIAYIHGSSQGQLVIETYIVMFLNGMIVLGMILLTETGVQSDIRKARIMAIIGLVLVVVFFSLLLSVFRSKAQGYPYSFLFK